MNTVDDKALQHARSLLAKHELLGSVRQEKGELHTQLHNLGDRYLDCVRQESALIDQLEEDAKGIEWDAGIIIPTTEDNAWQAADERSTFSSR